MVKRWVVTPNVDQLDVDQLDVDQLDVDQLDVVPALAAQRDADWELRQWATPVGRWVVTANVVPPDVASVMADLDKVSAAVADLAVADAAALPCTAC